MSNQICLHCQNKIDDFLENSSDEFCCNGCKIAYKIINEIGLSDYYKLRINDPKTRKIKPEIADEVNISNFVTTENNLYNAFLAIDGLHCAACVWLIESILLKQENVEFARINLSKKYLILKWRGNKEYGNHLISLIHEIGYKLFPFDEKILQEEEKRYSNNLLKCLAVAGFGAGNVMLFSSILWFSNLSQISPTIISLMHFFSALIALPTIIYSGQPFFSSALRAIKMRAMNMDLAISVAIFLACLVSLIESFENATHVYFDSAIMLVFFLLIGRYLDFQARKKAFSIAAAFSLLSANYARLITENGEIKIIATKDVVQGMNLLINAGDKIPADCLIKKGKSEIDMMIINGETLPKFVEEDCELFAGTINISAPLEVIVTKNQEHSLLKTIIKIVEEVEMQKNKYVRLADKLSKIYTPIVHLVALLTFIFWYFILHSNLQIALLTATAVLIITCPCALALAVPIVQTITISSLIKKGILIKSGEVLEKIHQINTIIFDKTGTLTTGSFQLLDIVSAQKTLTKQEKDFYLKLAASISKNSAHPVSQAIFKSYAGQYFDLESHENQGFGMVAKYENHEVKLGRKEWIDANKINNFNNLAKPATNCYLSYKGEEILFILSDKLKTDAKQTIEALQKMNKKIILLSGDNKEVVTKTAKELKIEEFYFEQTPVEKSEFLKRQRRFGKIIMVGDGLNDAPSLALADVSISFSQAIDLTKNIADIIVQGQKLISLIDLLSISNKSIKLIKQNLLLALLYNLFAVPFAIAGNVTPLIAAIAMSSSSILVLLNSLRINK